jgi:hypothetical protein
MQMRRRRRGGEHVVRYAGGKSRGGVWDGIDDADEERGIAQGEGKG